MTRRHSAVLKLLVCAMPLLAAAQGLDPTDILKPLGGAGNWPVYGGDYSGKRYSALTQIDRSNVKKLASSWSTKLVAGSGDRNAPVIVSGVGDLEAGGLANVKG